MRKNQHVVPRGIRWAVRGAGNTKDSRLFETQADAVSHARGVARRCGAELVIHGADGRIREKSCYGRDPFPPHG